LGGQENDFLLLKIIFLSHQNEFSDVKMTYNDISNQKYSRLRCLLRVKGLVICFYLGCQAVFFSSDKI
jgi:hypothetical protein